MSCKGLHGAAVSCMSCMGCMGLHGAAWAAWSNMSCMWLHRAAQSCMQMPWLQFFRISEVFKVSVNVDHCRGGCRLGSCRRFLLQRRLLLQIRQLFPPPPLPSGPPHPPATSKGWCPYDG
eukprot:332072-Chlamydomonas_euryale.AAC.1